MVLVRTQQQKGDGCPPCEGRSPRALAVRLMEIFKKISLLDVDLHHVFQEAELVAVKKVRGKTGEHQVVDVSPNFSSPVIFTFSE